MRANTFDGNIVSEAKDITDASTTFRIYNYNCV